MSGGTRCSSQGSLSAQRPSAHHRPSVCQGPALTAPWTRTPKLQNQEKPVSATPAAGPWCQHRSRGRLFRVDLGSRGPAARSRALPAAGPCHKPRPKPRLAHGQLARAFRELPEGEHLTDQVRLSPGDRRAFPQRQLAVSRSPAQRQRPGTPETTEQGAPAAAEAPTASLRPPLRTGPRPARQSHHPHQAT